MRILIIDDEKFALERLCKIVRKLSPDSEIVSFQWGEDFLAYSGKDTIDVAFLDIHLGDITGIELAVTLKKYSPMCNIIFVTSYEQYAVKAVSLHASGYVLKPYNEENIKTELENLLYLKEIEPEKNKLIVRTFGKFEVFNSENKPVHFSREASREIFAYLIDAKGAPIKSSDIADDILMCSMDKTVSKKISQYIRDLIIDLTEAGYPDVVTKEWKTTSVNVDLVDCDLYRLLEGDSHAVNNFRNNYLEEYEWAYHSVL